MLSLILAAALVASAGNPIFPVVHQLRDDIRLVQLSPETAVEQMTGQAAKLHIRNLMSRQPQAFAASRSLLTERGYVPTDHFYVERTINLAGKKRNNGDIQFAYSENNADGEIDIWSWDDGNADTWEGSIYVEVYRDGSASTWDGQIDDSRTDYPWIWYRKTWEKPGGGGPKPIRFVPPLPTNGIQLVSADYQLAGFYEWAVCWRSGVLSGCTAAAIGCRRVGPAWPECFGLVCLGAEVGSAIGCAIK